MMTIMHISDLHRTADGFNSNDDLLSALIRDSERFAAETPSISTPDAIIVSGDIIQGSKWDDPEYDKKISAQYLEASDFLKRLSTQFLNGQKSNLIIVPGNHDVDWKSSREAMTKVTNPPDDLQKLLQKPETSYRWSWKELCAYKIENQDLYDSKFGHFNKFITEFYSDANLICPIEENRDWNIFLLNKNKIGVVGFNSAIYNDCYYSPGCIRPISISRSHLKMREFSEIKLKIAVWHHNTAGGPWISDYLDRSILPSMVDCGFRIGLHGHQHYSNTDPFSISLDRDYSMAIVSAGSLCAGDKDLPHGQNRTYNMIQISDDFLSATINVREMTNPGIFSPSRLTAQGGKGFAKVAWSEIPILSTDGARQGVMTMENIGKAEKYMREKNFADAKGIIEKDPETFTTQYGRRLAIEILFQGKYWEKLASTIGEPENDDQVAKLYASLVELNQLEKCEQLLFMAKSNSEFSSLLVTDLTKRLSIIKGLRRE